MQQSISLKFKETNFGKLPKCDSLSSIQRFTQASINTYVIHVQQMHQQYVLNTALKVQPLNSFAACFLHRSGSEM